MTTRAFASEVRERRAGRREATRRARKRLGERGSVWESLGKRKDLRLTFRVIRALAQMFASAMFGGYDARMLLRGAAEAPARTSATTTLDRRDRSSMESVATMDSVNGDATRESSKGKECEDEDSIPEAGVMCACCRTRKTPLWRTGPTGAKTLCNACGVRFKNGRIVVDAKGGVIGVAPTSRKRPPPTAIMSRMEKHAKTIAPSATFRGASFAYKHVHDARVIELERVGARDGSSPFPRVHSATILTDYDGAVLLMLLHDGELSEDDKD